jgi:hypothetical protein
MALIAPAALVQGAQRLPLPYGLFSALTLRSSADRWEAGVEWERLICDPVGGIGGWQVPPTATTGLPKSLPRNGQGSGEATPFTVYGHFNCSPVGYTPAEAQARAEAHLLAREEQRVERAVWTGDLGNEPNFKDADNLTTTAAVDPITAIELLEEWSVLKYGALAVLHMTRPVALHLLSLDVLEVKGSRIQSRIGTPVVAGGGYTGAGPTGGTAPTAGQSWVYITPPLFYYRSEVMTSSNNQGDLLDRGVNNLYAIAERSYLVGYDPCGVGAALLKRA